MERMEANPLLHDVRQRRVPQHFGDRLRILGTVAAALLVLSTIGWAGSACVRSGHCDLSACPLPGVGCDTGGSLRTKSDDPDFRGAKVIGLAEGQAVADAINGRFAGGNAAAGTAGAGVLIHQWDNMEGTGQAQMWTPCQVDWCKAYSDRFSASLINAQSPKQKEGTIGLFSDTLGGFIMSPSVTVLCSYPSDGGSMAKKCTDDGSPMAGCVPGCEAEQCTSDMWWTCSFPADQLGVMFQKYVENNQKYNEVVVSTAGWDPTTSIEAFFYVAGEGGCAQCGEECAKSRDQQQAYLQTFAMAPAQVPLLCLDNSNWGAPFSDMSGQV